MTKQVSAQQLITDNLDIWTAAIEQRSSSGRGSSKKYSLHGIKKLRELILELAVRGKLVPQDANDEPASVLLERIAAEKAQLVKEKKQTKSKKLPIISESDKPFTLPFGWEFERFGNIYALEYGDNLPKPKRTETGEVNVYGSNGIVGTHSEKSVHSPCIVIGRKGSAGALNLCESAGCWVTDVAYSTVPPKDIDLHFSFIQFHTLGLDTLGKGIKPGLNRNEAYVVVLAIPPLEEQHRIVAKVDELMRLCDALEAQTEHHISAHQTLVKTLLDALLLPSSASTNTADIAVSTHSTNTFEQSWQRISEHFDTLFTTSASVDALKQTILQLAVMGKLVEQDVNDEPATKLLARIAAEKDQLIKDKKIKKQKTLPPIAEDEKPFELPQGWEFVRLGDLTSRLGSGSTPRGGQSAYVDDGVIFLRSQNVWNDGLKLDDTAYITMETHERMSNTHVFPNDVLLNITGASLGRCTIFPEKYVTANVSQHVTVIRLIELEMNRFLHLGIMSPLVQSLVWGRQVGMAIEGLSKKVLEQFEFPVPPLKEQYRIVAKVDELMALCDQLKASLADIQTTQRHFTDTIVSQVTGDTHSAKVEELVNKDTMKIKTILTTTSNFEGQIDGILAKIISEQNGESDAKIIWSKSNLELPLFYKQLKKEIDSGYINLPSQANFGE